MKRSVALFSVMLTLVGAGVTNSRAEATVKFSGDILYRWQYDYWRNRDDNDEVIYRAGDFSNRYWWNLRMSVAANENLSFLFRFGNPMGYFTDRIGDNLKWTGAGDIFTVVSLPEAYFKWNVSVVTLMGGIIPVAPVGSYNSVMDLVAFECQGISAPGTPRTSGYVNAGIMPYWVATPGTQFGVDLLLQAHKSDIFSLGIDLMGTVAADSGRSLAVDAVKRDQLRFILSLPMGLAGGTVSVLPVMHLRTNVYRSDDLKDANHSLAGGGDIVVKSWGKMQGRLTGRIGFAAAGYRNDSRRDDSGYVATAPLGMLLNASVKAAPGYGNANVDFAWGTWHDRKLNPVVHGDVLYWDFIYDCPVKSLVFRPRLRLWYYPNRDTDASRFHGRPELAFIARF